MTVSSERTSRPLNEQKRVSYESQVLYEFGTFTVSGGTGDFTLNRSDMNHKCVFVIVHHQSYPSTKAGFKLALRRGASGGYLRGQGSVNGIYTTGVEFLIIGTLKGEVTDCDTDGTYIYEVYYV